MLSTPLYGSALFACLLLVSPFVLTRASAAPPRLENEASAPTENWTLTGPLTPPVDRISDEMPLSDQKNAANWTKFEPLWDEFSGAALRSEQWWDHNPTWYGRAPSRFLGEGQNVHVKDGNLQLVMRRDDTLPRERFHGPDEAFHSYSSASVVSKALVRYGYFEVRSQAMNSGGSSSFWFASQMRDRKTGKRYRSEIDVFELGGKAIGHENAYHMNAHIFETPADGRRHWNEGGTWTAPFQFADDFHVFGLLWDAEQLVYYVDGVPVRRMKNTHWHAPLRLIFDSETMGDWLGMPEDKDLPSTFRIDYVRAWKNSHTDSDWHEAFTTLKDPDVPTNITRYVRSMDEHETP
ncbi:Beta-porphyranase A precursor [Novipirellula artificiosorum]|uniref:Beta-porphyranase A n=2 Tax=Novipirellula artificiosorum TaxID=2528016 RepID=A0A5C6E002_9BACT|nr:Beta-porphyranase A precursor [Novipirellula artificiosorum]